MTATFGKAVGCTVLAALLCSPPVAWAGPPVPGPPPSYEPPRWPVPVAGQWGRPPAETSHRTETEATEAPAQVIGEVNRHRDQAGCPALRQQASLNRAAEAHSADMAAHGRLSHTGTDGSSPHERMRAAGYHPGYSGEALAAGTATATAVVTQWMNSPPHRSILLTCRYTDAGVGRAAGPDGPWWTLDLAAPE